MQNLQVYLSRQVSIQFLILCCLLVILLTILVSRIGFHKGSEHRLETDARLGIPEFVDKVRTELIEIQARRLDRKQDAVFHVDSFDLEISFVAKVANKAEGGVKLEVVTAGASDESSRESTHKVTLHLSAISPQTLLIAPSKTSLPTGDNVVDLPPVESHPRRR